MGHRRRREILHLLQMEIKRLCLGGEFGHCFLGAAGVRRYEVGNKLLSHSRLCVYSVEKCLELLEKAERRLAHHRQNGIRRVFGGYFEAPRNVIAY